MECGNSPITHFTQSRHQSLTAQHEEVQRDDPTDGDHGEPGAQYHNDTQNQPQNVENQRGIAGEASGDQAQRTEMAQPGDAVGDEPDGEEQGEDPFSGTGVYHQHNA